VTKKIKENNFTLQASHPILKVKQHTLSKPSLLKKTEKSKPRTNMDDGSTRATKTKKVTSAEASEERKSAILSSRPASKAETPQQ